MKDEEGRKKESGENSNSFGWLSRVTRTMWECFIIGTLRRGPTSLCEKNLNTEEYMQKRFFNKRFYNI